MSHDRSQPRPVARRASNASSSPLPVVECCRLETLERCCEIDLAAAGRRIEHAQRAGDGKTAAAGDADTLSIVHNP